MLLENFYKIIHIKEREDGKQAIEIELNPGHVLYQGHFPGQPVVPGVCTLQIIKESAEQIANQPLQYVQIASSKFLSAINPLETPLPCKCHEGVQSTVLSKLNGKIAKWLLQALCVSVKMVNAAPE